MLSERGCGNEVGVLPAALAPVLDRLAVRAAEWAPFAYRASAAHFAKSTLSPDSFITRFLAVYFDFRFGESLPFEVRSALTDVSEEMLSGLIANARARIWCEFRAAIERVSATI